MTFRTTKTGLTSIPCFSSLGTGVRRGQTKASGLMFGVELADGSKASSGLSSPHGFWGSEEPPAPPTLALNNGGGGGGEDELTGTGTLWMWTLPPAGDLRLVAQWLDFGLQAYARIVAAEDKAEEISSSGKDPDQEGPAVVAVDRV